MQHSIPGTLPRGSFGEFMVAEPAHGFYDALSQHLDSIVSQSSCLLREPGEFIVYSGPFGNLSYFFHFNHLAGTVGKEGDITPSILSSFASIDFFVENCPNAPLETLEDLAQLSFVEAVRPLIARVEGLRKKGYIGVLYGDSQRRLSEALATQEALKDMTLTTSMLHPRKADYDAILSSLAENPPYSPPQPSNDDTADREITIFYELSARTEDDLKKVLDDFLLGSDF